MITNELNDVYFSGWRQQLTNVLLAIRSIFLKMNFYKKESFIVQAANIEHMAILASRIYVILLTMSVVILTFFNGLTTVTVSETVSSPSLAIFEKLYAAYPSTLSCSCQKVAISYDTILTVIPTYHQVSNKFFL